MTTRRNARLHQIEAAARHLLSAQATVLPLLRSAVARAAKDNNGLDLSEMFDALTAPLIELRSVLDGPAEPSPRRGRPRKSEGNGAAKEEGVAHAG